MSVASALPEEVDETERLFEKEADEILQGSLHQTSEEREIENDFPFVPGVSVSSSSVMMIIPVADQLRSRDSPSQLASIFT